MLDELGVPLTGMLGRGQLLRRRIRAGRVQGAWDCIETLAVTEWRVYDLEARLRALEAATRE